jgi:hypothetical protein
VYSDQPPPSGVTAQPMATPMPKSLPQQSASVVPKASNDDKALADKRKELEAAQATKEKQELAKKNQAACDQTRANLKILQGEVRVRETDANGERNFLNDEERQTRAAAAQKTLATHCKS